MTCEAFNGLLDALMDGELDDERRAKLEAHAAGCDACAASLRATLEMKALFDQLPEEVDVPLAAQARWRNAVRAEADARRRKKLIRWIGSAAAAVVVLAGVGLTLSLRGAPKGMESGALRAAEAPAAAYEEAVATGNAVMIANENEADFAYDAVEEAVLETDGGAVRESAAESAEEDAARLPACALSIRVADVDKACARIADLAEEYEGSIETQSVEGGDTNLYVEIDAQNAADFLSAVMPLDADGGAEAPALQPSGSGSVLVLITVYGNS